VLALAWGYTLCFYKKEKMLYVRSLVIGIKNALLERFRVLKKAILAALFLL
jgi:hypothetical protein